MSPNALYTNLSGYYDLMCADIDYHAQSHGIHRLQQMFGNNGKKHLDLACGTGPHVRHLLDFGYQSTGLDINQPMLDLATERCPEAHFSLQDMGNFKVDESLDLITCFLYSLHYNANIKKLKDCIISVHKALNENGVFCFNFVDNSKINNALMVKHSTQQGDELFTFSSGWYYSGSGNQQSLKLCIEKSTTDENLIWHDEHAMVGLNFDELQSLLKPYFKLHIFEHDYEKITPWDTLSGNAIFVCVKT